MVEERGVTVIMSLHELELAQKVSDYILCVKDGKADRYGTPEEIFTEEYIRKLYDLEDGCYSGVLGSVEIRRNTERERKICCEEKDGKDSAAGPEVFVIAGGGSGSDVFRKLNRHGISFAAGVLHRNDIDYELARMLAACVISEKAYRRIGDAAYEEALRVMKNCSRVICCLKDEEFAEMNDRNRLLLKEAEKEGIPVERKGKERKDHPELKYRTE